MDQICMHGYCVTCILPKEYKDASVEIIAQTSQEYAVITIENPFSAQFTLIFNAYKTLLRYMDVNGFEQNKAKEVLPYF